MKNLKQYLIMALLAIASNAFADELYVNDFNMEPGETKTVSVELNNPDNRYIMLEFELSLPEGIEISLDEDGELMVTPNGNRFTRSHVLEVEKLTSGNYKFLIYSSRNAALLGDSGELFTMTLTASSAIETGTYQGRFFNQVFANTDKVESNPEESVFNIQVCSVLKGDVNRDGTISIPDVTALVNIILGKDNAVPYQYDHDAADVNDDNTITIPDVTALVNIILGK